MRLASRTTVLSVSHAHEHVFGMLAIVTSFAVRGHTERKISGHTDGRMLAVTRVLVAARQREGT